MQRAASASKDSVGSLFSMGFATSVAGLGRCETLLESANSIGYPAAKTETMLRCDEVGRSVFFFRFRKWIWRGSSLIGFFLCLIPLEWNKEMNLFRIANRKTIFFFFFVRCNFYGNLFWKFLNISFEILKFREIELTNWNEKFV